jgi:hypothetical protein
MIGKFSYEPSKNGVVTAIKIYYADDNSTPMADLAFLFGGKETIQWTNVVQKEEYAKGINGYTFIFDERINGDFQSFVITR